MFPSRIVVASQPPVSTADTTSFISTWDTTGSDETVTIPFASSGSINFTIDWGDGSAKDTVTAYDDDLGEGAIDHVYGTADTYTIKLAGTIKGLRFNNGGDKAKIKTITQWGTLDISTTYAFYGCSALTISAADAPTISATDMEGAFQSCTALTTLGEGGSLWDVKTSARDLEQMFYGCTNFNADIDDWDMSSITHIGGMFTNCTNFNQDLNSWDVSNVTSFSATFSNAVAFNGNISSWDPGEALTMQYMFNNAEAFNQDISGWDVSKNVIFHSMFKQTEAFNADIGAWVLTSATTLQSMFDGAHAFNQDISDWDTSGVTGTTGFKTMFQSADAYNQPMPTSSDKWDVSNGTDFNSMFSDAGSFNQDLSTWDVSSVTDMQYMFYGTPFNQDLSDWTTSALTSMKSMFHNATAMVGAGLASFDIADVTTMQNMFNGGNALSTANYDARLIAWEGQSEQADVLFHAGDAVMTTGGTAEAARDALVANGWTIIDSTGTHT